MTNYHKVKGSEKQLVIVFGFDESYFIFNASETDPTDRITNPMLVGITRASSELILIQDYTHEPLPFIKMEFFISVEAPTLFLPQRTVPSRK